MHIFIALVANTAKALLWTIQTCMLLRAVLSWFPISDDNPILGLVSMVTEPVVAPVRALFERFEWFQDAPIDISFFAAYLLVAVVQMAVVSFA